MGICKIPGDYDDDDAATAAAARKRGTGWRRSAAGREENPREIARRKNSRDGNYDGSRSVRL